MIQYSSGLSSIFSTNRGSRRGGRRGRGGIRLLLPIVWALIILAPSERQMGANYTSPSELTQSTNFKNTLLGSTANRFSNLKRSNGIILASASYLDQVGELTNVMNEFVDALLEKVSFLATVVIESSLAEECKSPVVVSSSSSSSSSDGLATTPIQDQCLKIEQAKQNDLNRQNNQAMDLLDRKIFDEREYKNVDIFINAYNERARQVNKNGCKLFTLDVDAHDLPIESMEICCKNYGICYEQCGSIKHECDVTFRDCLRQMCKQNFDYKNVTILKRESRLERRRAPLNGDIEPLAIDLNSDDLNDSAEFDDDSKSLDSNDDESNLDDEDKLYAELDKDKRRKRETMKNRTAEEVANVSSRTAKRLRDKYKACKLASKLLIIGNLAFGCQHYKESQVRACCAQ